MCCVPLWGLIYMGTSRYNVSWKSQILLLSRSTRTVVARGGSGLGFLFGTFSLFENLEVFNHRRITTVHWILWMNGCVGLLNVQWEFVLQFSSRSLSGHSSQEFWVKSSHTNMLLLREYAVCLPSCVPVKKQASNFVSTTANIDYGRETACHGIWYALIREKLHTPSWQNNA